MKRIKRILLRLARRDITPGGNIEKWISGIGAALALGVVYLLNTEVLAPGSTHLLIASMGASAVLLFALPHSPLAQPYPLIAGHALSCAIGVLIVRYVPEALAPATAVGVAITSMYYLRCLHPPGGATALAVVVGGEEVHALGYQFVISPVLIDVLCLVAIAIAFNYFFPWRRYPISLVPAGAKEAAASDAIHNIGIDREDLYYALRHMQSYVDVTEQDLEQIYALALEHAQGIKRDIRVPSEK